MDHNEALRRSIAATLREIQIAHLALGLPIEPMDFIEAMQAIERIEARLRPKGTSDARNPAIDEATHGR